MNRWTSIIFTSLLAVFFCIVFVEFSIVFWISEKKVVRTIDQTTYSSVRLIPQTDNYFDVENKLIDVSANTSKDTPILVDFGRLGSFLYLAPEWSQSWVLTESGTSDIIISDVPGIMSLYDLFQSYRIYDKKWTFRLDQITNGSFYIGKEPDGKVAIYAIDGVIRLVFLTAKEEMTSMILFPWSYIRFDPSKNRSLKGADLFRTILSLQEGQNEVFEFVNPRVNIGDDKDTFFNYRLPKKSMILFRALSSNFRKKVENIDIQKRYAYQWALTEENVSSFLLNPSKKNHNMLVQLYALLSRAVDPWANSENLVINIGRLYEQAKLLNIQDNTAKIIVEQFLLDGRFALYGWVANSRYQGIYESIAKMIGIEPTSGKSYLLQSLADIYSRNLFTQKRTVNSIKIDTYWPTAVELEKTLQKNEIDQKDYFDIAIYAFNILRKTEENSLFSQSTLEDTSTYTYLSIFFRAANLYIESIEDIAKKQQTVMSFSKQFYDYIITTLSHSLYSYYTVSEGDAIYLSPDLREGTKLKISEEFKQNIDNINAVIEFVSPSIEALWSSSWWSDIDTYTRIQDEIIRLKAFWGLIEENNYKDYIKSPYKTLSWSKIPLPIVDEKTSSVIRTSMSPIEKVKNTKLLTTDPRILEVQKIWPDADTSAWTLEGDYVRVVRAPYTIARWETTSPVEISALYKDGSLSDILIFYNGYTLQVTADTLSTAVYYSLLSDLQYYLKTVDDTLSWEPTTGDIRIFPLKKRIGIGNNIYTVATGN